MANPQQLFLLADHIKLSLLERQRAISLNLEPNSQDGHISRSLDSMRDGVEAVEAELQDRGDAASQDLLEAAPRLRQQFEDLTSQYRGFPTSSSVTNSLQEPNNPSLAPDFAHAIESRPRQTSSSRLKQRDSSYSSPKSVRFSDAPIITPASPTRDADEEANRAALFPYRDDPDQTPDHTHLDNQQIHKYHSQVLAQQDEQLDRLGESIGRQRELSIQIGDELDSHVQLLDEVDEHVDRHQTRLDGARKRLGGIARKAKDNSQLTIIFVLILILIILIVVLK